VPNPYGLVGGFATLLANMVDKTHISAYHTERWMRLLEEAGFRQVDLFGEITFGANTSLHVKGHWWKHVSFNTVFMCEK
jgi:hypothetical protein